MYVYPTRTTPRLDPALLRSGVESNAERPTVEESQGLGDRLAGLFENFYVDLEEVRLQRGLDPVAALRGLEDHSEILRLFRQLGDRHTLLALDETSSSAAGVPGLHWSIDKALVRPACLTKAIANGVLHLPFRLERTTDSGRQRFWVTAVYEQAPISLSPGIEVTHWNGVPVSLAADLQGRWHRGAHPEARRALGLTSLAQRLLGPATLPCEDWVRLSCRHGDRRFELRIDWQTDLDNQTSRTSLQPAGHAPWRRVLSQPHSGDGFRCGLLPSGTAYLRLFSLPEWNDLAEAVEWLRSISATGTQNPQRALVLDLRGNAGGSVDTATRLARLLGTNRTNRKGPVHFQFRDTAAVRRMLNLHKEWRQWADPWQVRGTGCHHYAGRTDRTSYLRPLPLHPPELLEEIRPLCFPRIVAVVDALTYSAAEILVALLRQRNRAQAGNTAKKRVTVVGTDLRTGGSTSNAWSFETLRRLHPDHQIKLSNTHAAQSAVKKFCSQHNFQIASQSHTLPQQTIDRSRRWCLARPDGASALMTLAPDLGNDALNIYWRTPVIQPQLNSTGGSLPKGVDLQLAVRRAVLAVDDRWVPLRPKGVDHWLPITRRDIFDGNHDLLGRVVELARQHATVAQ